MNSRAISVVIPWADRDEVRVTLPKNHKWFKHHALEVLLVNCGGSPKRLSDLVQFCGLDYVRTIEVPTSDFNRSLALNCGICASRSPVLMMFDADLVLESDFVQDSMTLLEDNAFVTLETMTESDKRSLPAQGVVSDPRATVFLRELIRIGDTAFTWSDQTTTRVITSRRGIMQGSRAGSGMLVARKEHLLRINGYNSELRVWGWEDLDVLIRLEKVLGLRRLECGSAIHLTHDDSSRAVRNDTRVTNELENFLLVWSRYARGNFLGTYADDVASWPKLMAQY